MRNWCIREYTGGFANTLNIVGGFANTLNSWWIREYTVANAKPFYLKYYG